jgi:hypothetical protein
MPQTSNSHDDAQSSPGVNGASAPAGGGESTADVEQIATALAGSMPDVQEHAVAQAQREQQANDAAPTDKHGAQFDPAIHVIGPDGKGVLTVRGTWAQKRGRKAGSAAPVTNGASVRNSTLGGPAAQPSPQAAQLAQQQAQQAQARAAGVAAAEMLFMIGQTIGGEEWRPMADKAIGIDERATMHQAFGDYFVASGKTDIPPGAAYAMMQKVSAAPRFAMPKTQTRFQKIKGAIVTWWVNRKLRRQGLEVQVQAKPAEPAK